MTKTTPGAMKHTKGPWKAIEWTCHAPTTVVADGGQGSGRQRIVVIADCGRVGVEDSEANARLIAASPAMLEALQALMDEYKQRMDGDYPGENLHQFQPAYKMARAAISAATGEGKIG